MDTIHQRKALNTKWIFHIQLLKKVSVVLNNCLQENIKLTELSGSANNFNPFLCLLRWCTLWPVDKSQYSNFIVNPRKCCAQLSN